MPNVQMTLSDLIAYDTKEDDLYVDYRRRTAREARERDHQSIENLRKAEPEPDEKASISDFKGYFLGEGDLGASLDPDAGSDEGDCFLMFDDRHSNDYMVEIKYPTTLGINYRTRSRRSKETEAIRSRIRLNRLAKNYEDADDSMLLVTHGRQWKVTEVERLIDLIRRFGINLDAIALHFPTRPKRCIAAYFKRLYRSKHSGLLRALDDFNSRMAALKQLGPDSTAGEDCFNDEIQQIRRLLNYERERRTIDIDVADLMPDEGANPANGGGLAERGQAHSASEDDDIDDENAVSHLDILEGLFVSV